MNKYNRYSPALLALFYIFTASSHAAEWQLDSDNSQLTFISTKHTHISEVHHFKDIQGRFDSQGTLTLKINLASVDTNIAIRDERMKMFLFDVEHFATATLFATIDTEAIDAIAEGASSLLTVDASLELHGEQKQLTMDVIVTRLVGAKLSVVSVAPVIIDVADFSLVAGVEKLRKLAALPSISYAVPVSFYLIFTLKHNS